MATYRSMSPDEEMHPRCVRSSLKKYQTRPSPPYPAQSCPFLEKTGNDGLLYQSIPNVTNVPRWVKVRHPRSDEAQK